MRILSILAIVSIIGFSLPTSAETFEANNVSYKFVQKEDQSGRVCHLDMVIANYPYKPEGVRVEFSMARPQKKLTLYTSFIVDVIDIQVRNGSAAGAVHIPITKASFHSKTINSPGLFYSMDTAEDGSIGAATSDPKTTVAFWLTVAKGDFTIEFTRQDMYQSHAYHVIAAPTMEEFNKFNTCVQSLKILK